VNTVRACLHGWRVAPRSHCEPQSLDRWNLVALVAVSAVAVWAVSVVDARLDSWLAAGQGRLASYLAPVAVREQAVTTGTVAQPQQRPHGRGAQAVTAGHIMAPRSNRSLLQRMARVVLKVGSWERQVEVLIG
jgi:hypothetical protein